jgi:hypothetical protein
MAPANIPKHAGGRPPIWSSPEQLQNQINLYYEDCKSRNAPLTIAGLAVGMNVDRQTVYNYAKKDEFFDIVKKAREYVLASWEEVAITRGNAGTIFLMKNYGYTDRQEISLSEDKKPELVKDDSQE